MIRSITEDGSTTFQDESAHLSADLLVAVQAGMRAGFTEFTTPTPDNDDKRLEWRVRKWVTARNGVAGAFLVAAQLDAPHFEIVGPAIPLNEEAEPVRRRKA